MTNYTDIWQKLFNTIKDNAWLSACYNYDKKTLDEFPVAVISAKWTDELVLDTVSNQSTISYTIRVLDQNKDNENMEIRMRALCDSLVDDIRKNPLDDTIAKVTMEVNWWWQDDEQPMRAFEITCNCLWLNTV